MPVISGGVVMPGAALNTFRKSLGSPAAISATATHAAITQTASPQTITTGFTQPDVPRNLTVKGNASGNAGDVVLTGTDAGGGVLTETIALNGSSEVAGNKAFATLVSALIPAEVHAGTDTVSIGRGNKVGIGDRLSVNSILRAYLATVVEGTAPTVAVSSSVLASNTVALSSALAGTDVTIEYNRAG